MIEYTQGGWIPPQPPSASWRRRIHSAATRSAVRRSRPQRVALVAVERAVEQLEAAGPGRERVASAAAACTPVRSSSIANAQPPHGPVRRDHRQRHDRLPRPAAEVVDVQREPRRQEDHLGRQRRQVVPRPQPEQRHPEAREHARALEPAVRAHQLGGAAHVRGVGRSRRRGAARRTPRSSSTAPAGRRGTCPTSRRRAAASGSRAPRAWSRPRVRMPRNSRSSRSSASIVTLVSSSPFQNPRGSWVANRRWQVRSRAPRACASASSRVGVRVRTASLMRRSPGGVRGCGRRRGAPRARRRCRCAPRPSIVAGQPVSVQAPARNRFGTRVSARGRRRARVRRARGTSPPARRW